MNKKIIIVIAAVVVICILGLALIVKNTIEESKHIEEPPVVYISSKVLVNNITNKMNTNTTKVDSVYPQFKNLESNFNTYINSKIAKDVGYASVYQSMIEGLDESEIGAFNYFSRYERTNCYDFV